MSANDTENSSGTEYDAPAIGETSSSTQASPAHESENAFGGPETLHFALSVEASVAPNMRLRRRSNAPALVQSESPTNVPHNPWQKGDPRKEDALPESHDKGDGQYDSNGHNHVKPWPLPEYPVAERLFNLYFSIVNPIWPFLIEYQSRDSFNQTWTSPKQLDPLWIAQLNLIFCLSWQFYNDDLGINSLLENSFDLQYKYYRRAREIIVARSFDVVSVNMLQALLPTALYQQNTLRSRQCYLTVGHAVRVAQELGLHIPLPNSQCNSSMDKELCLRLWWGCFSLDR